MTATQKWLFGFGKLNLQDHKLVMFSNIPCIVDIHRYVVYVINMYKFFLPYRPEIQFFFIKPSKHILPSERSKRASKLRPGKTGWNTIKKHEITSHSWHMKVLRFLNIPFSVAALPNKPSHTLSRGWGN